MLFWYRMPYAELPNLTHWCNIWMNILGFHLLKWVFFSSLCSHNSNEIDLCIFTTLSMFDGYNSCWMEQKGPNEMLRLYYVCKPIRIMVVNSFFLDFLSLFHTCISWWHTPIFPPEYMYIIEIRHFAASQGISTKISSKPEKKLHKEHVFLSIAVPTADVYQMPNVKIVLCNNKKTKTKPKHRTER